MTDIRLKNYNMASARLIGGLLFVPLLAALSFAVIQDISAEDWSSSLKQILICLLGLLGALAFGWMALTAVTSLAIGDELVVGTVFGSKHYALSDIGSIGFSTETTKIQGALPVAHHLMMHIELSSGDQVQVKINQSEAEQVISFMRICGLEAVFQDQAA